MTANRNNNIQIAFETIFHSYSTTLWKELNSRLPLFTMSKATPQVQEYWLPGFGLSRNIVLSNIQYFLGLSATVRPYTYQVCPAQYCTSVVAERNPAGARGLPHRWVAVDASKCTQTPEPLHVPTTDSASCHQQQIEDLQRLSKEYERQARLRLNTSGGREPYINEPIPVGAGRRLCSLVKRQTVSRDLRALAIECEQRAQADLEWSRRASRTTGSEDATCHGKKRDDDSDEGPNGGQSGRDGKSDSSTPTRGSQSSSFSQRSSQNSANPSYGGSYSWALRLATDIARRYQLVYFHHV